MGKRPQPWNRCKAVYWRLSTTPEKSPGLRLLDCVSYTKSIHLQSIAAIRDKVTCTLRNAPGLSKLLPEFGPTDAIPWELPELPHTNRALFRGERTGPPLLGKTLNMAKVVAFNMKRHRRDLNRPSHTPQFN